MIFNQICPFARKMSNLVIKMLRKMFKYLKSRLLVKLHLPMLCLILVSFSLYHTLSTSLTLSFSLSISLSLLLYLPYNRLFLCLADFVVSGLFFPRELKPFLFILIYQQCFVSLRQSLQ